MNKHKDDARDNGRSDARNKGSASVWPRALLSVVIDESSTSTSGSRKVGCPKMHVLLMLLIEEENGLASLLDYTRRPEFLFLDDCV